MVQRRISSVRVELIKKAREAMLAAVQIYNNPQITFKAETFITLSIIAWTYLLHGYYRGQHVEYRYYRYKGKRKYFDKTKHGAYKYWELEKCLENKKCPVDDDTKKNLLFLIGIRHEIEHQMTDKIDEYLSAKLQACAINFDYYIGEFFGEKYRLSNELALAIQFSPLSPQQKEDLQGNMHIVTNVENFIVSFEQELSEETLKNSRYAYRVLFVPIEAKRRGQADQVVEFIPSDSAMAEEFEKSYAFIKETEKPKYRPKDIVEIMKNRGFIGFNMYKHTKLWQDKDAKNPKYGYGVEISGSWYWYQRWLEFVEQYCIENMAKLKGKE